MTNLAKNFLTVALLFSAGVSHSQNGVPNGVPTVFQSWDTAFVEVCGGLTATERQSANGIRVLAYKLGGNVVAYEVRSSPAEMRVFGFYDNSWHVVSSLTLPKSSQATEVLENAHREAGGGVAVTEYQSCNTQIFAKRAGGRTRGAVDRIEELGRSFLGGFKN